MPPNSLTLYVNLLPKGKYIDNSDKCQCASVYLASVIEYLTTEIFSQMNIHDRVTPLHIIQSIKSNKKLIQFLLNSSKPDQTKKTKLVPKKRRKVRRYKPAEKTREVSDDLLDRIIDQSCRYRKFENNGYYDPWWSDDSSDSDESEIMREACKWRGIGY